ncbi:MAG: hypothetical protein Q9190_005884 [Brigantiaea leucoxantha]
MSSSMAPQEEAEDELLLKSVVLVREEELEVVKAKYAEIFSIHMYSIGPSLVKNMRLLAECNWDTFAKYHAAEDPLTTGKQYGVVQNPRVKRKTAQRPAPVVQRAVPGPKTSQLSSKSPDTAKQGAITTSKGSDKSAPKNQDAVTSDSASHGKVEQPKPAEKSSGSKPPRLKKEHSDIFKSFAKSASKPSQENHDTSAAATASKASILLSPSSFIKSSSSSSNQKTKQIRTKMTPHPNPNTPPPPPPSTNQSQNQHQSLKKKNNYAE